MRSGVIPPILAQYINDESFKSSSLLLVTSVLGASANWLLLRLLAAVANSEAADSPGQGNDRPVGVILLSFLRDYTFWRDGASRLGIDIAKLAAQNRFICIDGLSELFDAAADPQPSKNALKPAVRGDHVTLRDASLASVQKAVLDLIARMNASHGAAVVGGGTGSSAAAEGRVPGYTKPPGRTLLILDGLDFLMAATESTYDDMRYMILRWRELAHSTVISASADSPLIHRTETPIEHNHRNLVVSMGFQARLIMQLRLLDTGTAKDVSGVLRISRGAEAEWEDEEKEVLYFVSGDGSVKVFERGA